MSFVIFRRPYRFFLIAAALAAILCLLPMDARRGEEEPLAQESQRAQISGVPAGADLSERTTAQSDLYETLFYVPCAHSVKRREKIPSRLAGLSRAALESEIREVIPGAAVTGFSAQEVTISRRIDIPCPLHWVLRAGEDGFLEICRNQTGEALSMIRKTDVPLERMNEEERQELLDGRMFDDVQALEGYLESMSS